MMIIPVVVITKIAHILTGWGKSLGILPVSTAEQKLSDLRMKSCRSCFFSQESKVLKIVKGSVDEDVTLSCSVCSCSCEEKSLVIDECCPKGKW
jgi:hypothetical protein